MLKELVVLPVLQYSGMKLFSPMHLYLVVFFGIMVEGLEGRFFGMVNVSSKDLYLDIGQKHVFHLNSLQYEEAVWWRFVHLAAF